VRLHFAVPVGIDDRTRPSGGNVYDRRLGTELVKAAWDVYEHHVADEAELAEMFAALPDGQTVLVDGLVGATARTLVAESGRLRLVVLLHMAVAEGEVLHAVDAVLTTSRWAQQWVVERHGLTPARVHVAVPGMDRGPRATGSAAGGHLLCVGPVTPDKGHDVLLAALGELSDLEWRCTCVGALDLDPEFVERLRASPVADRVAFTGPLTPRQLEEVGSTTDLVVSASRRESYGMAVAEGLARAIPAVATDVGGHPEAVGAAGVLVPVGDEQALADALRRWLTDAGLRKRLRGLAAERRTTFATWPETARVVSEVLARVAVVNRRPFASVSPPNEHPTEG
jgi:glycosyltransferase involved in cell wall biosynthesis